VGAPGAAGFRSTDIYFISGRCQCSETGGSQLSQKRQRQNLRWLLGQLAQVAVVVWGFLIAVSAVASSLHARDFIQMLGIGSLAIGFAFQNILQNFLAGILLLIHEPFRVGDIITVEDSRGTSKRLQPGLLS
jgi:small conductance mechanosensitive channel